MCARVQHDKLMVTKYFHTTDQTENPPSKQKYFKYLADFEKIWNRWNYNWVGKSLHANQTIKASPHQFSYSTIVHEKGQPSDMIVEEISMNEFQHHSVTVWWTSIKHFWKDKHGSKLAQHCDVDKYAIIILYFTWMMKNFCSHIYNEAIIEGWQERDQSLTFDGCVGRFLSPSVSSLRPVSVKYLPTQRGIPPAINAWCSWKNIILKKWLGDMPKMCQNGKK